MLSSCVQGCHKSRQRLPGGRPPASQLGGLEAHTVHTASPPPVDRGRMDPPPTVSRETTRDVRNRDEFLREEGHDWTRGLIASRINRHGHALYCLLAHRSASECN